MMGFESTIAKSKQLLMINDNCCLRGFNKSIVPYPIAPAHRVLGLTRTSVILYVHICTY